MPYYPSPYYNPYQMQQYPMQQQVQQPAQNQPQGNTGIIWVPSEQDALNYLVLPNTAVTLWNSNAPVVYLKQADASGKPSMRIYDLVERTQTPSAPPQTPVKEFATVSDLNALAARVDELARLTAKPEKEAKK